MKGKYTAAFIIPKNTKRILEEDGWIFNSSNRLPNEIKESCVKSLKLQFSERYLDIEVYINNSIQMSVTYDDKNFIEIISFQIYDQGLEVFKSKIETNAWYQQVNLFIPSLE